MAKKSKEELIVAYSGAAARTGQPAYNPNATPEQVQQATNNSRAAERNVERLRDGRIE
jgi:hypothetical protein